MRAGLDVYVESRSSFERITDYKLAHMLSGLRRANIPYRVLDQARPSAVGEQAFLHVDLTELPPAFRAVHRHYRRSVNGQAISISRLLYSRARVTIGDGYAGPVIVKTVLNHRGLPEWRFRAERSRLRQLADRAVRHLSGRHRDQVCPSYRVHRSSAEVPSRDWTDPRLIVERFLADPGAQSVTKHRLDFFYDVELNLRSTYDSVLCDPETVVRVEPAADVPEEVRAVRRRLSLDFGAIDYFMVDHEAVVIDANKTVVTTPSWLARYPFVARHVTQATDRLIDFVRDA